MVKTAKSSHSRRIAAKKAKAAKSRPKHSPARAKPANRKPPRKAQKSQKFRKAARPKKFLLRKSAKITMKKKASKPISRKIAKKQPAKAKKPLGSRSQKPISVQPPPLPVKRELSRDIVDILAQARARQWLVELGGENTLELIRSLPMVPSDEELAKKLKVKVSDVRASLNKLHNEGLVAYVRDKNSETGWYSYSWEINEDRIKKWMTQKNAAREAFRPREGVDLYFCKGCGQDCVLTFEIASDALFRCPSCSSPLDLLDHEKFEQLQKAAESKGR